MSETTGITAVSYIGDPKPNTAMYVMAKVGHLCENLRNVSGCLVFAEEGTEVAPEILAANEFRFSKNPLLAYAEFVTVLEARQIETDRSFEYRRERGGSLISEGATIGRGLSLGAGVIIGPDVAIGDNVTILDGATVNHAVIGDRVLVNERAVIGTSAFTMAKDADGRPVRIPALGKVIIGDDAEIGACDTIARGTAAATTVGPHAKLDAQVHLGESSSIGLGSELAAGTIVAGYASIGDGCFLGIGSVVKNRVRVAPGTTVGMGAVLVASARRPGTFFGNPARKLG